MHDSDLCRHCSSLLKSIVFIALLSKVNSIDGQTTRDSEHACVANHASQLEKFIESFSRTSSWERESVQLHQEIETLKLEAKLYRDQVQRLLQTIQSQQEQLGDLIRNELEVQANKTQFQFELKEQKSALSQSKEEIQGLKTTVRFMQEQNTAQQMQIGNLMQESVAVVQYFTNRNNSLQSEQEDDCSKRPSNTLKNQTGQSNGITYIRWGRNVCPSSATLVYKGYAGGSGHSQKGGGGNYLCLPENPQWGNHIDGQQNAGFVYGVEYEFNTIESLFSKTNTGGRSMHDNDAPCAVCLASTKSIQIMIPARRECPTGWTMEYRGYLAAEHYSHHRMDFICLDEEPEVIPGSHPNLDGALFYAVEGKCGSLPCPPYQDNWELTCVVCTK